MATRAPPFAGALVLAVVLAGLAGTAGAGAPVVDQSPQALVAAQAATPETDNTITRITVHENGSATWELHIRTRLETEADVEEYRAFQSRFSENRSRFLDDFAASISGIVADARDVTGREMAASGFSATTTVQTVPRRWGVVVYEFRWDGFAAVEGDRVVVGDVFQGGLFIAEGDALEVVGPAGHVVASAEPAPDESGNGTVTWRGREDFADGRPRVAFAPVAGGAGTEGVPSSDLLGGAVLVVAAVVAALGYRRWRGPDAPAAAEAGAAGGAAPGADEASELLADEDHVRRALAEHGGRMRQSEVKDTLDWSRSKTSRVLSRMEEAGSVRKLRLGRENVIDLADGEDGDG